MLEKKPINWIETEIIACKLKEKFISYYIKQLLNSNFDKKSQTSITGLSSVPALFALPLPTLGLLISAPANTPIYLIQPSGTGAILAAYNISALHISVLGPIPEAYMQFLSTKFLSAAHILPGIGLISAVYMQLPDTRHLPAIYKQLSSAILEEYIQLSKPTSIVYI